jgi:hypothetical protein
MLHPSSTDGSLQDKENACQLLGDKCYVGFTASCGRTCGHNAAKLQVPLVVL